MAYKVVYTAEEFLNRQFDLADNHGTDYDNHYPKNLLYRKICLTCIKYDI